MRPTPDHLVPVSTETFIQALATAKGHNKPTSKSDLMGWAILIAEESLSKYRLHGDKRELHLARNLIDYAWNLASEFVLPTPEAVLIGLIPALDN